MFLEPEDDMATFGWPWHGRVVGAGAAGSRTETISLPGGLTRTFPSFRHRSDTYLFDKGLPDLPDESLSALGGAWWGRAILRGEAAGGELVWGAGAVPASTPGLYQSIGLPGVPVWWMGEGAEVPPLLVELELTGTLVFRWVLNGVPYSVTATWTAADLGQGAGQPACAVRPALGGWRLLAEGDSAQLSYHLLGFHQNRLLLGVLQRVVAGTALPDPPGTTPGSSSPSGSPAGYYGLIEVTLGVELRDPTGDHAAAITMEVIEDRQQALGDPVRTLSDSTDGDTGNRSYSDRWQQTSGLLTAWYSPAGVIRTARYSRDQTSELETVYDGANYSADISRTTLITLLYGGVTVDQRELTEHLVLQKTDTLLVQRTITETGEPDDVVSYTGPHYSTSFDFQPLDTFMPGAHLVMGVVAFIVTLNVLGNVLDEQDVRLMWLVPHSNNAASLCRSREPYDYPEGTDTMNVQAYSGPPIGPAGAGVGSMSRTIARARTSAGPYYRSFFSTACQRWLRGTGNPVTGEVARANDYYAGQQIDISWV